MFKKVERNLEFFGNLQKLQKQQELAMERLEYIREELNKVESALMLSANPDNPNVKVEVPHIDYLHESVMHLQDNLSKRRLYLSYLGFKVY